MKKTIMLTMIMALGITASAMAAPTSIDEKDVPPAEVTIARLHAAPWHELGYIEPAAMVLMILLAMAATVVKCN